MRIGNRAERSKRYCVSFHPIPRLRGEQLFVPESLDDVDVLLGEISDAIHIATCNRGLFDQRATDSQRTSTRLEKGFRRIEIHATGRHHADLW